MICDKKTKVPRKYFTNYVNQYIICYIRCGFAGVCFVIVNSYGKITALCPGNAGFLPGGKRSYQPDMWTPGPIVIHYAVRNEFGVQNGSEGL